MLHKTSPVAGAAACLLHLVSAIAVALPPTPHFAQLIPRDAMDAWVSVGTDGIPITIQPSVTIIDGHESTISPAPEVTFTTTAEDGKTVTSTGRQPPAPTATATNGAGSFVVCDNRIGEHRPFCTPENGSKLYVGNTYYITWDPTYFADAGDDVEIEGWYSSSRVFESRTIDAGLGFYAWTITSDLLEGESSNSKAITLKLEYFETDSSGSTSRRLQEGPEVVVLDSKNSKGGDNGGGTKTIAIIVPLVVVAALLTLLIVFFCMKKKRGGDSSAGPSKSGSFGAFGGMLKRRSTGYGERQSRSQRTGNTWAGDVGGGMPGLDGKGPAIQLDESPTSPRAPGNNVFREEIRRQERGGY